VEVSAADYLLLLADIQKRRHLIGHWVIWLDSLEDRVLNNIMDCICKAWVFEAVQGVHFIAKVLVDRSSESAQILRKQI